MKLILPAAFLALALACAPAHAQSSGEAEGQQACGSDAFSLCGDAIPDRGRIEACLRRNFHRVSPGCRHYMASFGRSHKTARAIGRHYRHHKARQHHRYTRREERRHHYYYR
ncbi:MAG TPA: hypothetical protein VN655_07180 [Pseudolabrys sp.]|nr:hypothetical protein [Pseudolabrys sp.]